MSTDTGIDLVAHAPGIAQAVTIQVKTNLESKRSGGGKGKPALDWWIPESVPAQLVDLSSTKIWRRASGDWHPHGAFRRRPANEEGCGRFNAHMSVEAAEE